MKRYKFSDLLAYEDKIKKLYLKFGLNFNSTNRISKYFKHLSEIEKTRNLEKNTFNKLLEKDKAKFYFSMYYVLEIYNIVNAIEGSSQDEIILKNKLIDLSKGTYLLSEESSNNTRARDTTFELSLFSFFFSKGLNIKLLDPNPDLQLQSGNFTYNIECKRPNSFKTLKKHIRSAMSQLKKTNGQNSVPTIALSLEQVLLGDDLILDSRTGQTALSFLDATLYEFLNKNTPMIRKICGDQSCLILYYLSCLTGLKDDSLMANATFITGNLYNFGTNLSDSIYNDLQEMVPPQTV